MAEIEVKLPDVVAQKGALVGDEAVQSVQHEVEPEVNQEDVKAQVVAKPDPPAKTVPVNEVSVATDRIVTDPSSPEAVQVPDAGRTPGGGALPIHRLAEGTVEERFAAEASEPDDEPAAPEDTSNTP